MKKIQDIKLPTAKLKPGENFRTIIDNEKLVELSNNIRDHGILNPITVRIVDKEYQVVAGKRRLMAAQANQMKEVPCSIYEMTDQEADEMQLIENLMREDMHPLDEAKGYAKLLKSKMESVLPGGTKVKSDEKSALRMVSAMVGRSSDFIRKRSKLLQLIEEAQTLFKNSVFGYDEAVLICRLQPDDQKKALKQCWWGSGKEKNFYDANQVKNWISSNCFLRMENAPFPLDDATIFPAAGACTTCPKRTINANLLFEDMVGKNDTCTDAVCFNKKIANFIDIRKNEVKQKEPGTKILEGNTTYNYGHIKIGDKTVLTVSKKQYPEAVPVVITGGASYGKTEIGKIVHVLPDLKNPKVEKSASAKNDSAKQKKQKEEQDRVSKQCIHLRIAVLKELYKLFMKPGELKIKKGFFVPLLDKIASDYDMDSNLDFLIVLNDSFVIPVSEKSPEDFFDQWMDKNPKEYNPAKKKANEDYEKMGMGKALVLAYAMGSAFVGRDIGATYDNVGEVCNAVGFDHKNFKKKFLVDYKNKLAGAVITDLLKPTDGMKKAAAKSTTLPKRSKPAPAFMKPMKIGEPLVPIVGSKPIPKTEVFKKLWEYIKKHKLQDEKERRNINADAALQKVFNGKKTVSMFEMTKMVAKHLS